MPTKLSAPFSAATLALTAGLLTNHALADMLDLPVGYQYPPYSGAQPKAPSQRLHLILLGVANVERARTFYEALGWQISPRSDAGFVRIDLGGYAIGLLSREAFSEEVFGTPQIPQGSYQGIALAHLVTQPEAVPELLNRALQAGATLVKPVTRTPWGINAFFKSPDGHLFEIDYERTWVFDEDHRLQVDE